MQKSKQEKIDEFFVTLEKVIDIRCEISRERDRCNHRYVITELSPKYEIAKHHLEEALNELLDINSEE